MILSLQRLDALNTLLVNGCIVTVTVYTDMLCTT